MIISLDILVLGCEYDSRLKSANGRDVTKQAIIDVNSIVSGQNLTSIIAQMLTSQLFPICA